MILTLRLSNSGLSVGHVAELGRADRGEVLGVGEEHGPRVADPVVELDRAFGGLGLEVRGGVAKLQSHFFVLLSGFATSVSGSLAGPVGELAGDEGRLHQRDAGAVDEVRVQGASRTTASARAPGARWPTSSRRRARAPPSVAAASASSTVIRMSRTASAMQNDIEVV